MATTSGERPLRNLFRVSDWPLATKITANAVGMCALLALVMGTLGYARGTEGLRDEAQAAIRADSLVVTSAVDDWNEQRIRDLQGLARVGSLSDYLEASSSLRPTLDGPVEAVLTTLNEIVPEVDSIALLDARGTVIQSSKSGDIGTDLSTRDYFREAFSGRPFISGVSISVITNQPAIFYSVPVLSSSGQVVGVLRSRASLDRVQRAVRAARSYLALATGPATRAGCSGGARPRPSLGQQCRARAFGLFRAHPSHWEPRVAHAHVASEWR
jgi:C4-dicarboxylate-specific signal transduction histidine kinase